MHDITHVLQCKANLPTLVKFIKHYSSEYAHINTACLISNITNEMLNHKAIITSKHELYEDIILLTSQKLFKDQKSIAKI